MGSIKAKEATSKELSKSKESSKEKEKEKETVVAVPANPCGVPTPTKRLILDWSATKSTKTDANYMFDSMAEDGVEVDARSSARMDTQMLHLYFQRHLFEKEPHKCKGEFKFLAKRENGSQYILSFPFALTIMEWDFSRYVGTSIVFSGELLPKEETLSDRKYEMQVWKSANSNSSSLSQSLLETPFDFFLTGFDEEKKVGIHQLVAEANLPPIQMRSSIKMVDSESNVFHFGLGKKSSIEYLKQCIYHDCENVALPKDMIDAYLVAEVSLYEPLKSHLKTKIADHIQTGQIKLADAEMIRRQFKDIPEFTKATCFAASKAPAEYIKIRETMKK